MLPSMRIPCLLLALLIPSSICASNPEVTILDSAEKQLRFRGENINVELPELFEGMEYQFDLHLINNLENSFFAGNIFTSCGCTAATASVGKTILPKSPFNVRISFENLRAPILNSTINIVGKDDADLITKINIQAKVNSPFNVLFPNVAIKDNMTDGKFPVTIRSNLDQIDLSDAKMAAFGNWVTSLDVVTRSKNEVTGLLGIAIPNAENEAYSEVIFRISTSSFQNADVIELSVPLRRKVPLSIRPQHLLIPKVEGEPFHLKSLITGDFNTDSAYVITVRIKDNCFFSSELRPRTERMMLVNLTIPSEILTDHAGELVFSIDGNELILPFKLDGE